MSNRHILPSRKQELLELTVSNGFSRRDFEWRSKSINYVLNLKSGTTKSGFEFTLEHSRTRFFLSFRKAIDQETYGYITMSPGGSSMTSKTSTPGISWDKILGHVRAWLGYLKREIDAEKWLNESDLSEWMQFESTPDLVDRTSTVEELANFERWLRQSLKPYVIELAASIPDEASEDGKQLLKLYRSDEEEFEHYVDRQLERIASDANGSSLHSIALSVVGFISIISIGLGIYFTGLGDIFGSIAAVFGLKETVTGAMKLLDNSTNDG